MDQESGAARAGVGWGGGGGGGGGRLQLIYFSMGGWCRHLLNYMGDWCLTKHNSMVVGPGGFLILWVVGWLFSDPKN